VPFSVGRLLPARHEQLGLPLGWVAFLGVNIAMVSFAKRIRAHGLLVQQLGFTKTTLLGLYRWVGTMAF